MNKKSIVLGVVIIAVAILGLMLVGNYNSLVGMREQTITKFSNIQSQYQRRADLVPNLVSTVKGAANFEQETLTAVTKARAEATSITIDPAEATPEQIQSYQNAQGELSQALGRLLAVSENYPELRATEAFKDLQSQLEGTENRISVARIDYNEASRNYNTDLQTFPTNIIGNIFGFEKAAYFEADEGSEQAPRVDFE